MKKEIKKICKPSVFEELFNNYSGDLKRFIYYKTQDLDKTHDILQETFVKLWERCGSVDYTKVKSYLFTTANNIFLNSVKHTNVVRAYAKLPQKNTTQESPEYLMIEKEFLEKLEHAISILPETQKEVFLLSRIEKKKYREISDLLGISVKAVEKRMHLALKSMKDVLNQSQ